MKKQTVREGDVTLSYGDVSVEVDMGHGKGLIFSLREGQWVETGSSRSAATRVREDYAIGHVDDLSNVQEGMSRLDLSVMQQARELKQRDEEEADRERLEKLATAAKRRYVGKRVTRIELSGYSDDCHGLRITCEDGDVVDIMDLFEEEYTPIELALSDTPSTVLHTFAAGWVTVVAFSVPAEMKEIIPGTDKHVIRVGKAG